MSFEESLRALAKLSDQDLERPWDWPGKGHADLRNAFFYLLMEEQSALVVAATPTNEADRILALAQRAFGDLRGLLLAVPDALLDREPAPAEWSIRQTMDHTIRVERSYRANTQHALLRHDDDPLTLPEDRRVKSDPADTAGDALAIAMALARRRAETDLALAGTDAGQLGRPSEWAAVTEQFGVDVRFRLHRFGAHLVEHTQQVEKTLRQLGQVETDAQAYVRQLSIIRARHERRSADAVRRRLDENAAAVTARI
ncbi:MAG TPA: DinB family protein [Candidatus Acidoferrales bacterium]|nr:DinB family protein [Candidatus Acidoferrales bacterium]